MEQWSLRKRVYRDIMTVDTLERDWGETKDALVAGESCRLTPNPEGRGGLGGREGRAEGGQRLEETSRSKRVLSDATRVRFYRLLT